MSYGLGAALQSAIYQKLLDDPEISTLIGDAIFDAPPAGKLPVTYVSLGPESVRERSDISGDGAEHRFMVSVITEEAGFGAAKQVAAAVSDALVDADLSLARGRLVGIWFDRATAHRSGKAGRIRRVDLTFRARVEDN